MDPLLFLKIIISLFLAILFLQSGLDKVFDWKGNLDFHKEHFANSPLKHFSTANLAFVAFLEICCGALCLVGAAFVFQGDKSYALMGAQLAAVIFTMLFFGQRISKDYKGAVTIVTYFILAVLAIFILGY